MVSESMCRFDKLYRLGIQQRHLAVSHAAEMAKCKLIGLDKGFYALMVEHKKGHSLTSGLEGV